MCLCQGLKKSSSLSQCPVKFLTILKFGETVADDDYDVDMEKEMEKIKHFLVEIPNLEQLIIHYTISIDDSLVEVANQLQMHLGVGSLKCMIQLISGNLSVSITY